MAQDTPPPSCLCLRDAADLRRLVAHTQPSRKLGCGGSCSTAPPWLWEAPAHVIGCDEHLRAAAGLETAGHTWRAHATCFLYLSGTRYHPPSSNHTRSIACHVCGWWQPLCPQDHHCKAGRELLHAPLLRADTLEPPAAWPNMEYLRNIHVCVLHLHSFISYQKHVDGCYHSDHPPPCCETNPGPSSQSYSGCLHRTGLSTSQSLIFCMSSGSSSIKLLPPIPLRPPPLVFVRGGRAGL